MTLTTRGIRKTTGIAATLAAAGAVASLVGAGSADAATHGIKLTSSQTAVVAHQGLGNAFSTIPYIPNLVYNPTWGRLIQLNAEDAARRGGCIEVGIITRAGRSNIDYVTTYPARSCAR